MGRRRRRESHPLQVRLPGFLFARGCANGPATPAYPFDTTNRHGRAQSQQVVAMLSVKQAAERLGISVALVYALCAQKRIRHERHGLGRGVIRIPEDAIEEYRRTVTVEPAAVEYRPAGTKKFKHLI